MRAARFHGRGDIRIDEVPEPEVTPGTVKIEWCGICGTDLHEYQQGPIFCPTPDHPHPLTGECSPVVLGHEFSGAVVELGQDVNDLLVGDRVVVEPRMVCGVCPPCLSGRRNSCHKAATIGLQGGGGGLAEFVVVDRSLVFSIGDLPFETGALVEPLAVAHHAVSQAALKPGQTAAVFGGGPIGLLTVCMLKARGAGKVILVEPSTTRRNLGIQVGADHILDPLSQDVNEHIQSLTAGYGVDIAFECAGLNVTLAGCLAAVRAGGTVVNIAISGHPLSVDMLPVVLKEISIIGTICYADDHQPVIDLLRCGSLSVEPLITKRIDLANLVREGFETLATSTEKHVKILVHP